MGFLGGLIGAGASIIGGVLGSRSNEKAADTASAGMIEAERLRQEGYDKARAEFREAAKRGIGAINAGTDAGIGSFRQAIDQYGQIVSPMLNLQETAQLTPAQLIALEDLTRDNNAYLASSGLRGAGRAGVAAVMDQRRRFIADALDRENRDRRARSDSARSALAQVTAQGLSNIGSAEIGRGRDIASTETGAGQQIGQTYQLGADAAAGSRMEAGQIGAASQLATGQLWGNTIGAIGSILADEIKADRLDPYSGWTQRAI